MTAQEKAKELIEKFTDFGKSHTDWPKQCAIACVDEIIEAFKDAKFEIDEEFDFWNKVKDELFKL
jgi:hypothetical protein